MRSRIDGNEAASLKVELIQELRRLLHDVFALRATGVSSGTLANGSRRADEVMRMLLEGGFATKRELLTIVAAERASVSGPATREVSIVEAA